MRYPVTLEPVEEGGYFVSFPDIPEALTQGDTREEALEMALDALITAFEFYFEDNEKIPLPGPAGQDYVDVPLSVASKVLMLNAFLDSKLTQIELANRMGVKKQEVTRIFDLRHSTKIDTVGKVASAIGHQLTLSIE
ncbi:type II toxin-antitoxin system HicB family antitoxin [Photorhabdus laumondii subsp. laumondii]|uniref:Type II toxin-antitoxin system HicB family antitoxin n=1 Tax=Photorhabdus laumondii subsp. laumondii TaxID=141679 RepID=A0A6L9JV35_PHOLM|nr:MULTISPECIES: type II toxin-antitoxin system HicB family antitoxin [Photorhabdus]AWK43143.1 antitoxin [Photorhabdus laumondii subsp. laumondii]AXG43819.1 antitoxin [Photorhabdus laumondii subsp. laumondii]MCC8385854.1 type II toxin-antitoxin system HicB family antitoxin [Photorhabdus laumondii]MCC8390250.1 type II toxin-antitoxin system HicB family antitoxin [Photorhabdus laumondii]MCC8414846.1 type II toxin-antitoxin system HicB family antitoxin [Photorhabdus laumondii]